MSDYATLQAPDTLRFERLLPGPIERVWAFIAEPEKRRLWLAGGTAGLVPGGNIELVFRHDELSSEPAPEQYAGKKEHVQRGVVLACDPPRLLSHTWDGGTPNESEVTFELTPRGDKVLLVVTHAKLTERPTRLGVAGGWHTHLSVLADQLEQRERQPFWPMFSKYRAEYENRLP